MKAYRSSSTRGLFIQASFSVSSRIHSDSLCLMLSKAVVLGPEEEGEEGEEGGKEEEEEKEEKEGVFHILRNDSGIGRMGRGKEFVNNVHVPIGRDILNVSSSL